MDRWPKAILHFASAVLFVAACSAHAEQITYRFSWTASGSVAFTDAAFLLDFAGDTANVVLEPAGYLSRGLTGELIGPFGTTSTLLDQYVGIQVPKPGQSIGYGGGSSWMLDMGLLDPSAYPDFSSYDLKSAFGPMSGSAVQGAFVTTPLFPGSGITLDVGTARDFSFEAIMRSSVPEPGTLALLGLGLAGLGVSRRRKTH